MVVSAKSLSLMARFNTPKKHAYVSFIFYRREAQRDSRQWEAQNPESDDELGGYRFEIKVAIVTNKAVMGDAPEGCFRGGCRREAIALFPPLHRFMQSVHRGAPT